MILRTETVEQAIDGNERGVFVKDVVMTPGPHPLGMVRKRVVAEGTTTRGTVILIHGFGQNRYTWHSSRRSFANYLAREGWDVFNVDLRGHGRSRRFGAPRPKVMYEYIEEDVPAFVREAIALSGHDEVFLVGHSMGGLISYAVGSTSMREHVRGLVTIGSPYRFGQGSALLMLLRDAAAAIGWTGLFDSNPALPVRFVGKHLQKRAALWDNRILPLPIRGWVPGGVEKEVLDEYLSKTFEHTSLAVALDIFKAGSRQGFKSLDGMIDYSAAFEMLDRPLLVIAGTEDQLAPPESVKPAYEGSKSHDKTYRAWPLGHLDLVMGREATRTVWPMVRDWLARR
ncbi:alpha/beta hydrolase [Sandaracinus amylolyticus]|uniref:alpha/beta hydrolase n=1 Tax=Sandaracinus amylolyticus TaxID=927083 RepID=UPI001F2A3553|nr:alpha/beta hydrolase [Sandaracinus amylolyticus]UJR79070.1 Polyhydroxyalkanoic acid synthase [Sandaracinus amylolyticus]